MSSKLNKFFFPPRTTNTTSVEQLKEILTFANNKDVIVFSEEQRQALH